MADYRFEKHTYPPSLVKHNDAWQGLHLTGWSCHAAAGVEAHEHFDPFYVHERQGGGWVCVSGRELLPGCTGATRGEAARKGVIVMQAHRAEDRKRWQEEQRQREAQAREERAAADMARHSAVFDLLAGFAAKHCSSQPDWSEIEQLTRKVVERART